MFAKWTRLFPNFRLPLHVPKKCCIALGFKWWVYFRLCVMIWCKLNLCFLIIWSLYFYDRFSSTLHAHREALCAYLWSCMLSFQDDHTYADPEKNETSLKKFHNWCSLKNVIRVEIRFFYTTYLKINTLGILVWTSMLSYSCRSIFKDRILMNRDFFKLKYSIPVKINLLLITSTLQLPWVFKTEFLLRILIQYKQTSDESKEKYQ